MQVPFVKKYFSIAKVNGICLLILLFLVFNFYILIFLISENIQKHLVA